MNGGLSDLLWWALMALFLLVEPLLWLLIIGVAWSVFFRRLVIERKPIRCWLTIGVCVVSLLLFCTIEWFGWGLHELLGWRHTRLLDLYGIGILAGTGSGWLLYQGGWRIQVEETKIHRRGHVLRSLGLSLWSVTFLLTFAAIIWWATT